MLAAIGFGQTSSKIFTQDIDNFWVAFDSIESTNDYSKKLTFINSLYIEKGTPGLQSFMELRDYNDSLYVRLIDSLPKFWHSVRENTLSIKSKTQELNQAVETLRSLYPELRDAQMYFTIGGLRSGGTTQGNMVLVGAEIATGDSSTNMAEFKNDWLKKVFSKQSIDNIVYLNIHEYIHTQQTGYKKRVMNQCIAEGSCDFIAELVLERPIVTQYLTYGREHAPELKAKFSRDLDSEDLSLWLYNGGQQGEKADLGYYIGYEICKSYYMHAADKKQAIKDIIELNYDDNQAVETFVAKSKYL